jgi:hypothetical protein
MVRRLVTQIQARGARPWAFDLNMAECRNWFPRAWSPTPRAYLVAAKLMFTSALSASSTLKSGRGVSFMKLATNVSGIC